MSRGDESRAYLRRGDGGYALVIALLIMAVLFVVASSFLRLTLNENLMASADRDMILALNAAEAGVQQAIQNIKMAGSLTALLGDATQNRGADTFLTGQRYSFRIENDPAEAATPTVDGNGYLKITSTGRARNATRIVETVLYVPKAPGFPGALHVPGAEGDASLAGTSFVVDGHDTDPATERPTGDQTKTRLGVSAGSQGRRDDIYRGVSNAQRNTPVFTGLPGDSDLSGNRDGQVSLGVNGSLDSQTVARLASLWATFAMPANTLTIGGGTHRVSGTHTYARGAGGGPNPTSETQDQAWGTRDSPGVFNIQGITPDEYAANPDAPGRTLEISGNFQGAGILIVQGAALSISGNFRWEGIILVTGPRVSFQIGGGGHQKIFGAVVVNERSTDRCARRASDCNEVVLLGNPTIRYSLEAINRASGVLRPRIAYWNERGA